MTFLLDVNVLIALIDPGHVAHDDAHGWFEATGHAAWATCPMTENGVIRIVGNPKYSNSPGSPAVVAQIVTKLRALHGHSFWPDDVSLVGSGDIDAAKILTPAQVTDTYLSCARQGAWRPTGEVRSQAVGGGREGREVCTCI